MSQNEFILAFSHLLQNLWEKRLGYVQVVVELIGSSTHRKETHIHSYSDAVSHLFQTAVDVCVYGVCSSRLQS